MYLQAKAYFEALDLPRVISGDPLQKVIFINFDGTGNNKDTDDGKKAITNVAKIYGTEKAADLDPAYISGLGTEGADNRLSPLSQATLTGAQGWR